MNIERKENTMEDKTIPDEPTKDYPKYLLPDKVYKALKWLALIALPAIGLAYQSVAGIWNLPLGGEVMQTCTVAGLLCGVLIGASEIKALQG